MRVACFCFGAVLLMFSAWFFYDGFVTFPRQNREAAAVEATLAGARQAGDAAAADAAAAELETRGRKTEMDLLVQKICGVLCALLALPLLAIAVWPRRKKPLPPPALPATPTGGGAG